MKSITVAGFTIRLDGEAGAFAVTLTQKSIAPGIDEVIFSLEAAQPSIPAKLSLVWNAPMVDMFCLWLPTYWREHAGLPVHWSDSSSVVSMGTQNSPLACVLNQQGKNRITFAFSDTLNPVKIAAGVHEESASIECRVELFATPQTPVKSYKAVLRIDTRPVQYHRAIEDVALWWAAMPNMIPSAVPESARLPMYSSWYSFHQDITPENLERQSLLAKAIGCESIIVDDGWQTMDSNRGYAYCGDWEVAQGRIPDMAAHVAAVHRIGLKYLLWFGVPFVGRHSKAYKKFEGKYLDYDESKSHWALDPRFPEVREFLIGIYERSLKEWDLDGFKLDFVDCFTQSERSSKELGRGRDYDSVPAAADRLLSDVMERLRRLKPDIMIEFRQAYNGPLMRKYGNMFRAVDCPGDIVHNRIRTIDVRLTASTTPAHADMMMWNPEEPVEHAALQLLHTFFSVPQISVLLDKIPTAHIEMLTFWLKVWREHRDVILDGTFMPQSPECQYPAVYATTPTKRILAAYAAVVLKSGSRIPGTLLLINGTLESRIAVDFEEECADADLKLFDCRGRSVSSGRFTGEKGLRYIDVPPAGLGILTTR